MTNTAGAVGAVAAVLLVLYTFSSGKIPAWASRRSSAAATTTTVALGVDYTYHSFVFRGLKVLY